MILTQKNNRMYTGTWPYVSIGFVNSVSYKYYRNMEFMLVRKYTTILKEIISEGERMELNNQYYL